MKKISVLNDGIFFSGLVQIILFIHLQLQTQRIFITWCRFTWTQCLIHFYVKRIFCKKAGDWIWMTRKMILPLKVKSFFPEITLLSWFLTWNHCPFRRFHCEIFTVIISQVYIVLTVWMAVWKNEKFSLTEKIFRQIAI